MVAKEEIKGSINEANKKIILNDVKNNFFESNDKITWSIYVKDLDQNHSSVDFTETNATIRFKTNDKNFLNLHGVTDHETSFEWNVDFFDRVQASSCVYKINKSTMEITLKKAQTSTTKWASAIKRSRSKETINKEKILKQENTELKQNTIIQQNNNKQNSIQIQNRSRSSSLSSSSSPPPTKQEQKKINSNYYGYTGLVNLGNTCYMNAAIQFLANATDFRDYFLLNPQTFQKEINMNNALGLNGKMAVNFALLMRQLWNSNSSYITPNRLKDLICSKYSNFRGYEQQDTQEFMCSLLSLIHEDLNRVLKKPFYESGLECENDSLESTLKVADESWKRFLSREDSIIVDNFYGQFKSKLTCPECNKISITFEPFNNLLVPLAKPKSLTNFLLISKQNFILSNMYLGENELVKNVLEKVKSDFDELKNSSLCLFVVEKSINDIQDNELNGYKFDSCYEVLSPESKIPTFRNDELIMITEIIEDINEPILELRIEQTTKYPISNDLNLNECSFCEKISNEEYSLPRCTRCYRSAYCNSECQKNDWSNHSSTICLKPSDRIGFPFILTFKKSDLDCNEDLEDLIRNRLVEEASKSVKLFDFDLSKKSIYELELIDDELTSKNSKKIMKIDTNFNNLINLFESKLHKSNRVIFKLKMKWNNNSLQNKNKKIFSNFDKIIDSRAFEVNSNDIEQRNSVNLDECLNLFTQTEKLTSENPWYCSNCKKHQEATKQMNLWKLPKYLIITLKRFQASKASDNYNDDATKFMMMNSRFSYLLQNRVVYNKLNTFVNFPLRGLDMGKYLINQGGSIKPKQCIYDLCGVINHLGRSLTVGHYTAFARTHDREDSTKDELSWRLFDDQNVMPVHNEKQIKSNDAYVLMYRIRNQPFRDQESDLNQHLSSDDFYDAESDESAELNFTNLDEID